VNRFEIHRGANVAVHPLLSVTDTPVVEENSWKASSENEQREAYIRLLSLPFWINRENRFVSQLAPPSRRVEINLVKLKSEFPFKSRN
jgi:hypothetical protein